MHKPTVLAIDDSPDNLAFLSALVERYLPECTLYVALGPHQGLDIAQQVPLDAILVDVNMPEIDGLAVCRRLKSAPETANVPVLLMTGERCTSELRARGLEAGADDFITRPLSNEELRARIRVLLRVKRVEDALRGLNARLEAEVAERTEALQARERSYRSLLENASDGILVADTDGRWREANFRACELFGRSRDEILGGSVTDLVPWLVPSGADSTRWPPKNEIVLRERWLERKGGPRIAAELSVRRLMDGRLQVLVRDVTRRKEMEEELQRREALYRGVVDNIGMGVSVVSRDLEVISTNRQFRAWQRVTEASEGDGRSCRPDCGNGAPDDCPAALTLRDGGHHERFGTLGSGRVQREFRCLSSPLLNAAGETEAAILVKEDVTEARRAAAAVRRERDRAQTYLETAQVILLAFDTEGRIRLVNPKGCEVLGWDADELVGCDWFLTCVPPRVRDRMRGLFDAIAEGVTQFPYPVEYPVLTSTRTQRLVRWHSAVLRDTDGRITGVLSSGEDITDQRHLEQLVLEASEREQRSIARDLHDDVGQLMAGVRMMAGALEQDLREAEQDTALAERLGEYAERALQLTRSLAHGLRPVGVDPDSLEPALRELAETTTRMRSVQCSLEMGGETRVPTGDAATHLYRIVQESVNNAARHSGAESITIRVAGEGRGLTVEIEDDGTGIAPERRDPSSGMGIRIMECRAAMVGGKLDILDGEPTGTRIRFSMD